MNYYLIFIINLFASLFAGILLSRIKFEVPASRGQLKIVILSSTTFIIIYSWLSCLRYDQALYGLWDFGSYYSAAMNMAHFKGFCRDFTWGYFEHFSPLFIFWVPFYWIFDSPYTLLVGQALLLGAAGIPLYFLAKKKIDKNCLPVIVVLMYFLNPYLSRFTLYEYHMGCFFPILFFSAWLCWENGKKFLFLILMLLAASAKESFCIVIIANALYFISIKKNTKWGLILLGTVTLLVLFILFVWFPHIIPLRYHHTSRYPEIIGADFYETATNCVKVAQMLFNTRSLAVLISVFLPFVFIPLLSKRVTFLFLAPILASQIFSLHSHQQMLQSHYSDILIAAMPVATILALSESKILYDMPVNIKRIVYSIFLISPFITNIFFCELPHLKYNSYIPQYHVKKQLGFLSIPFKISLLSYPRSAIIHEMAKSIPEKYTVCTQNNLGTFFIKHKKVFWILNPGNPDFYVFDVKSYMGFNPRDKYIGLIKKVWKDKNYRCIFNYNGSMIFCRKEIADKVFLHKN
jgi:uncharacterized membrane protein